MFCTRCATLNPPTLPRCGTCGARLQPPGDGSAHRRRSSDTGTRLLLLPLLFAFAAMALIGWRAWETRQTQAAAYDRAVAALSNGNLPRAISEFGAAGGYRDAQEQRVTAQQLLAPYQAALLDARSAIDEGDHRQAVLLLRSVVEAMPDNADAASMLVAAETGLRADLVREIAVANLDRDWLAVERATLGLAAWDGRPPDADALTTLRLTHAPILFTRNGALFWIGPDMADETRLFDQVPVSAPIWSPDRRQIAFFSALPDSTRFAALFVIGADGTNLRLIDQAALMSTPAWSPDGLVLAYVAPLSTDRVDQGSTLRFFEMAGETSRDLALPDGMTGARSPSWSGDGTQIAALVSGQEASTTLLIIDAISLEYRAPIEDTPANARTVSWSPGADDLLVWTTTGDSDWYALRGSGIYLVSLASGTVQPVTSSTQAPSRPVWSPDGDHFAFLDRGVTLHVRTRVGIGQANLELPSKGSGMVSWAPGGVGLLVPALDPAKPSMIVPVGKRLGPAELLTIDTGDGFSATDFQWGPQTEPDPALFDPLRTPVSTT